MPPSSSRPFVDTEVADITQEEDALTRIERLEEALAARDDLIRLIGHELRNPLSPVYMQACHLTSELRRRGDDATYEGRWLAPRLDRLQRGLERLLERLNRLMDAASLMSPGGLALIADEVDLTAVAADVVVVATREAKAAGSQIQLVAPLPVVGRWDRTRLAQVVGNLVSNAIRHGGGASIEITVGSAGDLALLTVTDHGPGIPAERVERLFERFDRLTPRPERGGMGLGLWAVHQLCRAMGGSVALLGQPVSGASFVVTLPRGTTAPNAPEQ